MLRRERPALPDPRVRAAIGQDVGSVAFGGSTVATEIATEGSTTVPFFFGHVPWSGVIFGLRGGQWFESMRLRSRA